jgi:hypothetical protein
MNWIQIFKNDLEFDFDSPLSRLGPSPIREWRPIASEQSKLQR